jgi:hypothetical protein
MQSWLLASLLMSGQHMLDQLQAYVLKHKKMIKNDDDSTGLNISSLPSQSTISPAQ